MLLVVIAVAGAAIDEESEVVNDKDVIVDARGWRGAAGWIILVAGISVITEGIVLLLRYLNPRCFNNSYGVFGGLVRKIITGLPCSNVVFCARILPSVCCQGSDCVLVVLLLVFRVP